MTKILPHGKELTLFNVIQFDLKYSSSLSHSILTFNYPWKRLLKTLLDKKKCWLLPAFSRFTTRFFLRTKSVTKKEMNKCMVEI